MFTVFNFSTHTNTFQQSRREREREGDESARERVSEQRKDRYKERVRVWSRREFFLSKTINRKNLG